MIYFILIKLLSFPQSQEMILMVGAPATGKSTFRKRYLEPHGYVAVNRDTMGTMQKCVKVCYIIYNYY